MSRKLGALLSSGKPRERAFAGNFLDAYEAKVKGDTNWRKAQARWTAMVKAELKDPSIDTEEAEKRAMDELETAVLTALKSRKSL